LLSAVTGREYDKAEFTKIGERIFNLEKMFNYREGFRREGDRLPDRFFAEKGREAVGVFPFAPREGCSAFVWRCDMCPFGPMFFWWSGMWVFPIMGILIFALVIYFIFGRGRLGRRWEGPRGYWREMAAEAALLTSRSQLRQAQRSIAIATLLLDLSLGRIQPGSVRP